MLWLSPSGLNQPAMALAQARVHIWRISIAQSPRILARLGECLSPSEWERANRFRFDRDRDRFIASRSSLRHILGRYLECAAKDIAFGYGEFGKPFLMHKTSQWGELEFNLSHSGDLALCAVGLQPVGIDIEQIKARSRLDSLAQHCLSTSEYRNWHQQPEADRLQIFLKYWTCKEAYLKAVGKGLTQAMSEIELVLKPWIALRHWNTPNEDAPNQAEPWTLKQLAVGEDYVAAIAAAAPTLNIIGWQYDAAALQDCSPLSGSTE
ncbi:MAG: 4'-phosphopantetheinyl transferase superfamily protein [Cyanobacteria bacterium P01_D01_bin.128]